MGSISLEKPPLAADFCCLAHLTRKETERGTNYLHYFSDFQSIGGKKIKASRFILQS